jgi:alpha-L-fucosidase 2
LSKATEDSLLTYSRGGVAGAESNIFAIDGNCAGAAGIAEMLLQSHADELHLLPALPSEWPEGKIVGLKARGNIEVSLFWSKGRLEKAILKSRIASSCTVRYGAATTKINLTPDKELEITARQFS